MKRVCFDSFPVVILPFAAMRRGPVGRTRLARPNLLTGAAKTQVLPLARHESHPRKAR